jgi:hypothetical protein
MEVRSGQRGARNANIIKILCRDEAELNMVQEAAREADIPGAKILRERFVSRQGQWA